MNVHVSNQWGAFLRSQVRSGRYASEGAVLDEALRLRRQRDQASIEVDEATPVGGASAFDVLARAGLIGCIPGASGTPADLSTNPAHMEGFGRD